MIAALASSDGILFRRKPQQTPREFLATLPDVLREEGAPLTDRFEQLRYGAVDQSR